MSGRDRGNRKQRIEAGSGKKFLRDVNGPGGIGGCERARGHAVEIEAVVSAQSFIDNGRFLHHLEEGIRRSRSPDFLWTIGVHHNVLDVVSSGGEFVESNRFAVPKINRSRRLLRVEGNRMLKRPSADVNGCQASGCVGSAVELSGIGCTCSAVVAVGVEVCVPTSATTNAQIAPVMPRMNKAPRITFLALTVLRSGCEKIGASAFTTAPQYTH